MSITKNVQNSTYDNIGKNDNDRLVRKVFYSSILVFKGINIIMSFSLFVMIYRIK